MTDRIIILVGSMSGTAELVAEVILEEVEKAGFEGRIARMEKVRVEHLAKGGTFIICTSTYGTGDVPDNAQSLYKELQERRPELSGVTYGVFALGDSIYPNTFCFGGRRFDELLSELGAKRVAERHQHDSRAGPYGEQAGAQWAANWLDQLKSIHRAT